MVKRQKEVKKKLHTSRTNLQGWDAAIYDAEAQIVEGKRKLSRLRAAIKVFRSLKAAGQRFPGDKV